MHRFEWSLPTSIIYGPGELARLGEIAAGYGKKALLVTYVQKPHRAWILEKAVSSLKDAGLTVEVYDRIEPNPRSSTVDEGVKRLKEFGADLVVALGGGSVIDAAKYISSTAYSGGSSWDYVILNYRPAKEYIGAYPIVAVPTVSASGSEANAGGVITNWETKEKSFSRSPYRIPKAAIVDPEVLAPLPPGVTADGGADIFSHLIEHYLSSGDQSEIADRVTEALILTLMEYLDRALADGDDLEARGQIALCSLLGWSGIQALGRMGSIPIHFIEHQLSGHYDISHGRGMAVIMPAFLNYFASVKPDRWARLARSVFGLNEEDDPAAAGKLGELTEAWLEKIGLPTRLGQVGIDDSKLEQITDEVIKMYGNPEGLVPGPRPMTREDILTVLQNSL